LNIKLTTKPNWLLLIVSVLLLIMVFLPWWSWGVSYEGFHIGGSVNGFHSGGILTFLMSLAGIALSFLEIPTPKYRSYAILGIGVLALLGVLISFASYSGSSMGFGRILALIVSLALIAVGYFDYRGVDLWAKIKASTSQTPPSQPPPSSPPPPPPPTSPPSPPPSSPPQPPPAPPPAPPAQQ
jgi:peptidoglycan/LPS O-acetylase OafA/YrhL